MLFLRRACNSTVARAVAFALDGQRVADKIFLSKNGTRNQFLWNCQCQRIAVDAMKRELVRVTYFGSIDVNCTAGEFWLTQDGSRADVVIGIGQSISLQYSGSILIQALDAGRFSIVRHHQDRTVGLWHECPAELNHA